MIGYAFMGAAHSQAWRSAPRFFDLPVRLRMSVLAGRNEARAKAAADKYGWDDVETDWTRVIGRDDVDIVDICTPGDTHAEMATAALAAGKHVLCEKPLANSVAEAEAMAAAARRAASRGVRAMCGFTYRRVPAARLMADLVAGGVPPPCRGGWRRTGPGRARSATSARTQSTSRSTSPATPSPESRP